MCGKEKKELDRKKKKTPKGKPPRSLSPKAVRVHAVIFFTQFLNLQILHHIISYRRWLVLGDPSMIVVFGHRG